ncbi:DarT ssDNA thymidine ADP-ribosyltransferase family protein [Pseudomonas japonica]|uniref:DarT ssDNA thymidine ADP-ribosyltransferase family protein n=1 Tax=Pseudomonas japonica TaxID=256466 RepID=UPI003A8B03C9
MVQQVVKRRGIEHLIHFTRTSNLTSILTNGLISRSTLQNNRMQFSYNDDSRYDQREDRTCLTITFPNCKMFYPMTLNYPADDWAVIRLSPSILWELDCLFTETNAATRYIRDTADEELRGAIALEKLFANEEVRNELRLNSYDTTDVQAEVMVSGTIPPHYIIDLNFNHQYKIKDLPGLQALARNFPQYSWKIRPEYFYQR